MVPKGRQNLRVQSLVVSVGRSQVATVLRAGAQHTQMKMPLGSQRTSALAAGQIGWTTISHCLPSRLPATSAHHFLQRALRRGHRETKPAHQTGQRQPRAVGQPVSQPQSSLRGGDRPPRSEWCRALGATARKGASHQNPSRRSRPPQRSRRCSPAPPALAESLSAFQPLKPV